jgi:hypothetical protein
MLPTSNEGRSFLNPGAAIVEKSGQAGWSRSQRSASCIRVELARPLDRRQSLMNRKAAMATTARVVTAGMSGRPPGGRPDAELSEAY